MAAITSNLSFANSSGIARAETIRMALMEHNQELTWLAEFLTDDETVASACVIDASTPTEDQGSVLQEWLQTRPREATIRSALDVQRGRIAQLASVYERKDCIPGEYPGLPLDAVEFVVSESDLIRATLDTICRFVLVLCGFEKRRSLEVALLLGLSEHAVEAAYCAANEILDVIRSQSMLDSYGYAAVWN